MPAGLPVNLDAERFILGGILLEPDKHFETAKGELLNITDFSLESHKRIWRAMLEISKRDDFSPSEIGDLFSTLVGDELHKRSELASVGGLSYLAELFDDHYVRGCPHLLAHIKLLKEKTALREIMAHSDVLSGQAQAGMHSAEEIAGTASRIFGSLKTAKQEFGYMQIPSISKFEDHTSYLVEDLIIEGGLTMWSGESGDGKSTLSLALCAAVAQGLPFLGRRTIKRPVLYMDRENPLGIVKERWFRLNIPEDVFKIWGTWLPDRYPPGPDSSIVIAIAKELKPLIVWDSLVRFAGCEENSASEMSQHLQFYRNLCAAGATCKIIHHRSEKGDSDYRGSSDIRAAVDSAWAISRDDGTCAADALGRMVLRPYKTRGGSSHPIRIEYKEDSGFIPLDNPSRDPSELLAEILRIQPGSTQSELTKAAMNQGLSKNRTRSALGDLVEKGEIETGHGKGHTIRYYLRTVKI